jgi:acetyltransferase-like isoleucine patch superfamily enzyme
VIKLVKLANRIKRLFQRNPESPNYFYTADDPKYQIFKIGKHTYGKPTVECFWENLATLKIGKYCSIAGDVVIFLGGEHRSDWVTTYPFNVLEPTAKSIQGHPWSRGDVNIGNDVWIGTGAFIRSGVTIGSGAIIGAKSVVTKNVEAYEIVAGNPARTIRKRFSDKIIQELLEISWWDWPEEKVRAEISFLLSNNIEDFIRRNRNV